MNSVRVVCLATVSPSDLRVGFRVCFLLAACCIGALSQTQQQAPVPQSELARQNMARVAASTGQLIAILHRDPGLMVELKRWIAKDATDHGQLIADTDLTDEAIFERLETDTNFRGVATLLVRKYGYLQPLVNPESPLAKEQELLIQERVKWLAQDEESERANVRQQQKLALQKAQACDARINSNCPAQAVAYPSRGQQSQEQPGIDQVPAEVPGLESPQTYPSTPNPYNAPKRTVPTNDMTELLRTGGQDPLATEEMQTDSAIGGQSAQSRNTQSDEGGGSQRSNQSGQNQRSATVSNRPRRFVLEFRFSRRRDQPKFLFSRGTGRRFLSVHVGWDKLGECRELAV